MTKRDVDPHELRSHGDKPAAGLTRRDLLARGALGFAGLAGLSAFGGLTQEARAALERLDVDAADPLAVPRAELAAFRRVPKFTPPGPPINISSAKGKHLFYHSITFGVQIVHTLYDGVKEGAAAAGMTTSFYDAKGRNDLILAGF